MFKDIKLKIIKICYDNGENYVMATKDENLTGYSLNKAINTGKCPPNFFHEVYAIRECIKGFHIQVLQEGVSYREEKQLVSIHSKRHKSVKMTHQDRVNLVVHSAMNRFKDAFYHKGIVLTEDDLNFLKDIVDKFSDEPDTLKKVAYFCYKVSSFEEFKNIFIEDDD